MKTYLIALVPEAFEEFVFLDCWHLAQSLDVLAQGLRDVGAAFTGSSTDTSRQDGDVNLSCAGIDSRLLQRFPVQPAGKSFML